MIVTALWRTIHIQRSSQYAPIARSAILDDFIDIWITCKACESPVPRHLVDLIPFHARFNMLIRRKSYLLSRNMQPIPNPSLTERQYAAQAKCITSLAGE